MVVKETAVIFFLPDPYCFRVPTFKHLSTDRGPETSEKFG